MRFGRFFAAVALLALLVLPHVPALAEKLPVDLELVIAVDVSGSVDAEEWKLQREGYYRAFTDPRVLRAIRKGVLGRIGVVYMEWAGAHYQRTVVDWMVVDGDNAANILIDKMREHPHSPQRWTSISGAIDYSVGLLDASPFEGTRRVIDISGDGSNNNGRPVEYARKEAIDKGYVINGLPVVNDRPNPWGSPAEANLDKYYERFVIGGPGAFIVVADGFEKFGEAILTKLILEISGTQPNDPTRYAALPRD